MFMYEWDPDKNRTNIAKHRVSFETASGIFDGPVLAVDDNREDYGEVREISIGMVGIATFLTVTHTDRHGVCRIISARVATSTERKRYEQALKEGRI
jgi:uncharacterized protein